MHPIRDLYGQYSKKRHTVVHSCISARFYYTTITNEWFTTSLAHCSIAFWNMQIQYQQWKSFAKIKSQHTPDSSTKISTRTNNKKKRSGLTLYRNVITYLLKYFQFHFLFLKRSRSIPRQRKHDINSQARETEKISEILYCLLKSNGFSLSLAKSKASLRFACLSEQIESKVEAKLCHIVVIFFFFRFFCVPQ